MRPESFAHFDVPGRREPGRPRQRNIPTHNCDPSAIALANCDGPREALEFPAFDDFRLGQSQDVVKDCTTIAYDCRQWERVDLPLQEWSILFQEFPSLKRILAVERRPGRIGRFLDEIQVSHLTLPIVETYSLNDATKRCKPGIGWLAGVEVPPHRLDCTIALSVCQTRARFGAERSKCFEAAL